MARGLACTFAVLTYGGFAAGCHGTNHRRAQGDQRAARVPTTVASAAAGKVIGAVISSPRGEGFGFLPHGAGRTRCRLPEGGPVLRPRIEGVCTIEVRRRRGYAGQTLAVFTETWPWRLFHYAGKRRRPQTHSWTFVVLPGGDVKLLHQGGDFPPQAVM